MASRNGRRETNRDGTETAFDRTARAAYWRAKRELEGLVDGVDVRLDARLRPQLVVSVSDSFQQYWALFRRVNSGS